MYKFDEAKYLEIGHKTAADLELAEKAADAAVAHGFDNIFMVGVGGSMAMLTAASVVWKQMSNTPVYLEHAAELMTIGNRQLTEKSLIITVSKSGDTKEVTAATAKLKEKGCYIVAFTSSPDSPIGKNSDGYVPVVKADLPEFYYMEIYTFLMRIFLKQGEISEADYAQFKKEVAMMPENMVKVKEKFDPEAERMAEALNRENYILFVGGGQMWGENIDEAMCVVEEALWVRTKSVSSADLFHGTLELIDDLTPVILIKGEGPDRALDERAERFLKQTPAKLFVVDTKDYELEGVEEKFRWIYAPFIACSLLIDRLSIQMSLKLGHDMQLRRYYRQFEY
ncbi:SIS domain-containing protein [Laedolimicola sp.]|uniref:SIS domain-containing protein n=1 Tax=Laedolimicola sp. TaxID=2981663 RepID=UPI003F7F32AA